MRSKIISALPAESIHSKGESPIKISISLLLVITLLSAAHGASTAPEPALGEVTLGPITGTVLETMDAAGYTYMRLKTAKGEIWAAVQKTTVKKGSEVTVLHAVPMDGFESRTMTLL